jgi:hypothetical protein
MVLFGRVCGLALGVALSALAMPAMAQSACPPSKLHLADAPFTGIGGDPARAPCADPTLPPATSPPLASEEHTEAPAEVPAVADMHVAATELGFDRGIAPAPGRTVGYRGHDYLVVEVAAVGNGPTFSGGSRFVITTQGGALEVGLKAMDGRDRQMAATSLQ